MIERNLSTRLVTALILGCGVLASSGCMNIYAVLPSDKQYTQMYDQRAVTQTQEGIAVTVGSPGPTQTYLNFGILISNYKKSPVKVNFDNVKILVNGRPLPIRTLAELQDEIRRVEKLERWSTGLSAANASLAQSNAQIAATATAKNEGRALTQQLIDQHKNPVSSLAEANNALMKAANALGNSKAADLAVQSNAVSWRETYVIRWDLNSQVWLNQMKTQEQYYWRSETIAPGQSVLRSIYVHPDAWVIDDIIKDGQYVDVEVRIGKLLFPFRFLPKPLTSEEFVSETKAWQQRNAQTTTP